MNKAVWLLSGALLVVTAPCQAQNAGGSDHKVADTAGHTDTGAGSADQAWGQLQESFDSKRVDTRIQALSALSLLGGNARAEGMVRKAMRDESADVDVREAAIVAAGQMDKDRGAHGSFRNDLRNLLSSSDPKLSFTAATTLWGLKDTAGQDVLVATAEGERAGEYSFLKRSEHNASRTLHNPEALAKIAVLQSLTILVPPVGMGMGAYGYLKGTSGASPQVTAIEQLAKVHTPEVQKALIVATQTKDAGARIAAAESLAKYTGPAVRDALAALLNDDKQQVRLTASAAYLHVAEGSPRDATSGKAGAKGAE